MGRLMLAALLAVMVLVIGDMRPSLAVHDVEDGAPVDAEFASENGVGWASTITGADAPHLCGGQCRAAMLLATGEAFGLSPGVVSVSAHQYLGMSARNVAFSLGSAPLHIAVLHVRAVATQEQVIRTDAGRIIAAMADHQAVRDGAVVHHPRHTMGGCQANSVKEQPVAIAAVCGSPYPTVASLVNLGPETDSKSGSVHTRHFTLSISTAQGSV